MKIGELETMVIEKNHIISLPHRYKYFS